MDYINEMSIACEGVVRDALHSLVSKIIKRFKASKAVVSTAFKNLHAKMLKNRKTADDAESTASEAFGASKPGVQFYEDQCISWLFNHESEIISKVNHGNEYYATISANADMGALASAIANKIKKDVVWENNAPYMSMAVTNKRKQQARIAMIPSSFDRPNDIMSFGFESVEFSIDPHKFAEENNGIKEFTATLYYTEIWSCLNPTKGIGFGERIKFADCHFNIN